MGFTGLKLFLLSFSSSTPPSFLPSFLPSASASPSIFMDMDSSSINHLSHTAAAASPLSPDAVLFSSVSSCDVTSLQLALSSPSPPLNVNHTSNPSNMSVLQFACERNLPRSCEILLADARVDVNLATRGASGLYVACERGHVEVVKLLLGHPATEVNKAKQRTTPFNLVCHKGSLDLARLLLQDPRTDVNAPNKTGATPFGLACYYGHFHVVEELLRSPRVEVNRINEAGITPFWQACERGRIPVVKMLLASDRVEVNRASKGGLTPLGVACKLGRLTVVQILLGSDRTRLALTTLPAPAAENGEGGSSTQQQQQQQQQSQRLVVPDEVKNSGNVRTEKAVLLVRDCLKDPELFRAQVRLLAETQLDSNTSILSFLSHFMYLGGFLTFFFSFFFLLVFSFFSLRQMWPTNLQMVILQIDHKSEVLLETRPPPRQRRKKCPA